MDTRVASPSRRGLHPAFVKGVNQLDVILADPADKTMAKVAKVTHARPQSRVIISLPVFCRLLPVAISIYLILEGTEVDG